MHSLIVFVYTLYDDLTTRTQTRLTHVKTQSFIIYYTFGCAPRIIADMLPDIVIADKGVIEIALPVMTHVRMRVMRHVRRHGSSGSGNNSAKLCSRISDSPRLGRSKDAPDFAELTHRIAPCTILKTGAICASLQAGNVVQIFSCILFTHIPYFTCSIFCLFQLINHHQSLLRSAYRRISLCSESV
jgi:hypothetical protein